MASGKPWFAKNYALTHLCWTKDSWGTNRYWPMQVTSLESAITPVCVLCRQDCSNAVHSEAFPKGF
jgi:hypothetical protein